MYVNAAKCVHEHIDVYVYIFIQKVNQIYQHFHQ